MVHRWYIGTCGRSPGHYVWSMPPPDPSIWGIPTANIALGVSCVAAIFTGISLWYVRKGFRRAGAAVKLTVQKTTAQHGRGSQARRTVVAKASNEGLASVEVTNVYFDIKGHESVVPTILAGNDVPGTVGGLHEAWWMVPFEELGSGTAKIRVGAHFGGIPKARSRWVKLRAKDLV